MRPLKYDKDQELRILTAWNSDQTIAEIADREGLSKHTVRRIAVRSGISGKRAASSYEKRPNDHSTEVRDKVVELYNSGMTGAEIAAATGTTPSFVSSRLKRVGQTGRTRKLLLGREDEVIEYCKTNSIRRACKHFSVSENVIRRIMDSRSAKPFSNRTAFYDEIDWELINLPVLMAENKNCFEAVARKLGFTSHHVKRRMKDLGETVSRPPAMRRDALTETKIILIMSLRDAGYTHEDMIKISGLSTTLVKRAVTRCEQHTFTHIPPDRQEEFAVYMKAVRRLTFHIRNYCGLAPKNGFHWNHRLSIVDCFLRNIPIDIAASVENLELVPSEANLKESSFSMATVAALKSWREERNGSF